MSSMFLIFVCSHGYEATIYQVICTTYMYNKPVEILLWLDTLFHSA